MILYNILGADKQLNEIVFAGSHDAGITSGDANVKTQALDIEGQAQSGVRVFDLRIAAASAGIVSNDDEDSTKAVELRAFHADSLLMKDEKKQRYLKNTGQIESVTRTKLKAGGFGEPLVDILEGAGRFVGENGGKEFLILKFDKCLNWLHIAKTCVKELGSALFNKQSNLNTTKLKDLEGKVIVLFSSKGLAEIGDYQKNGILGFRNLYDKSSGGDYQPDYKGLQYYGKGGTPVMKPVNKVQQNVKKQGKLMYGGFLLHSPEVMGMMYWTTTGLFESISERNDTMWTDPNVEKLKKLWHDGLGWYIAERNPMELTHVAFGPNRRRFLPNIIMIDFADAKKCQVIYDLNTTYPWTLEKL